MNEQEEDPAAELARLKAENAALKAEKGLRDKAGITLKVSAKGAVSLYGLGRFPVTLYKEQWERVIENANLIGEFMKAHQAELKLKPRKEGQEETP